MCIRDRILTSYKEDYRNAPTRVTFNNGQSCSAVFFKANQEAGFTLLKLEELPINLRVAKIGKPTNLTIGQKLKIVNTLSTTKKRFYLGKLIGIMGRKVAINGKIINYLNLETTALQNNLSGPLFNLKGELLGLISSKFLIGGNGRMAVAVSINTVLETI